MQSSNIGNISCNQQYRPFKVNNSVEPDLITSLTDEKAKVTSELYQR